MGENPFDSRYAEVQLNHRLHTSPQHLEHAPLNNILNGEEEPYTIKCICGFADDDGNTVLCEQCNTWQHILCYYHPTLVVPEVHKCAECYPRPVDSTGATQRQRRNWEPVNTTDERRIKRTANKSQKRTKTRDQNHSAVQQNGWLLHDHAGLDTRNGVPWDQPPPAKRPKTMHRNSTSISAPKPLASRELNGIHEISVFRPPKIPLAECPQDYLSPDFIRLHRDQSDFTVAQANTHLNIDVANLLATWLDDVDAFADVTQGKTQAEVFKYLPTPIEALEAPVCLHRREDPNAIFHGHHPVWKYITVDRDTTSGGMIGEIRGTIGLLEDYKADPDNDWERLRHPDHFVFFHPNLPLFIDCRREGTLLRYVRRSCKPNIKMQTVITGEREYRFCFTAMEDIPRGAEITVGWDLRNHPQLMSAMKGEKMSFEEKQYLQDSIQTILAHFGDCACEDRDDQPCLMGRFDHRLAATAASDPTPQQSKSGRKRKPLKRSPPRTAIEDNSRAGSELLPQDDDMDDSRSTSRSTRSKTSREATPITAPSRDITQMLGSELSERDKKKLIQEEMLFNKLEQDKQHGQRKKKRSSGSNVNTPSASNSKPSGRRNSVTSNSNTTPAPSGRNRGSDQATSYFSHHRSPSELSPQPPNNHSGSNSRRLTLDRSVRPPKPVYVSQGTQTGSIDDASGEALPTVPPRRTYMPLAQRLLRRCHFRAVQESAQMAADNVAGEPYKVQPMGDSPMVLGSVSPTQSPKDMTEAAILDVEMKDVSSPNESGENLAVTPTESTEAVDKLSKPSEQPLLSSHPPIKPPAPPWPSAESTFQPPLPPPTTRTNIRATHLRVDLPPPPFQSGQSVEMLVPSAPPTLSGTNSQTPTGSAFASAPSAVPTTLNLSLTQPSPLKKKMSLSDYTAKMKAKTPGVEKAQTLIESGSSSPATSSKPQLPSSLSIAEQNEPSTPDAQPSQSQEEEE